MWKKNSQKPIENDTGTIERRDKPWLSLEKRPRGLRIRLDGTVRGLVGTGVHGLAADQVVHGLGDDQSWSYGCSILFFFLCKREKLFDFLNLVSS